MRLKRGQETPFHHYFDKILQDVFDVGTYTPKKLNICLMTATKFFLKSRTLYSAIKMGYLWKPCKHLTSLLLYQKDLYSAIKMVMLILLIDNATDGMWKIGGAGKYSLNQDHREEFVARRDTWSADYSMNEEDSELLVNWLSSFGEEAIAYNDMTFSSTDKY
uniref:Uncharacterized protein n=1 Tax=Salix viminalis TaxID=40686 RepID=A0A6N2LF92_SALVM